MFPKTRKFRSGLPLVLVGLTAIALLLFYPRSNPEPTRDSSYAIAQRKSFNQPSHYPLEQEINPDFYQPTGTWVGRLILPPPNPDPPSDWVEIELYHTPEEFKNLRGEIARLEWSRAPEVQAYVQAATADVRFSEATRQSQSQGIIHPQRLDGRDRVGPLQSLAGARPSDDVIVRLNPTFVAAEGKGMPILQIAQDPVQVTGRFYGLVKILGTAERDGKIQIQQTCPGESPCPSEFFRIRHYNRESGDWDGPEGTIRIPQQPRDRGGIFPSTPRNLAESPAGEAGWYIYGARDAEGIFTVQALVPRSLLQLEPNEIRRDRADAIRYIQQGNWHNTPNRKGTVQSVLLSSVENPLSRWQEGDRALVLHLFGGIGGEKAEANTIPATTTGHFTYGIAEVARDRFTDELRFDIQYHQVYAHNTNGIVAGTATWANYMGDLQKGWLSTRPVSDILIKLDAVTQDYNFGGILLSPLAALQQQLQVMTARYRTGDGTGSATVTPATSCVQDSNQALYIAIERIKQQVAGDPNIQTWLQTHADDPQTRRFQKLVDLGTALEKNLAPFKIVRSDWKQNAEKLAGTRQGNRFVRNNSLLNALLSWRTVLPRRGQDEIAHIFRNGDAQLWFLRTNQVGGENPEIAPVAPTVLFGQKPLLAKLFTRCFAALTTLPGLRGGLIAIGILLLYGAIALPIGFSSGFLHLTHSSHPLNLQSRAIAQAFITPALAEEFVFRAILLPHPIERIGAIAWLFWGLLSLLLFVLYHPLNARSFYRLGYPTFFNPIFLALAGLLGLACTIAYRLTGSLWAIAFIHWFAVSAWLFALGGKQKLEPQKPEKIATKQEQYM